MSVNSNYIVGDSRSIKKIFEENKIAKPNVIISSPPYFDVLNYNNNSSQIGYGQNDYDDYLQDVCKVFQDCYDLSENNSSFWLIVDTFKKDGNLKTLPFDIVSTLKTRADKTWILKEIIIWDKEKNLPWNGHGHFKNQFEYILFFTKAHDFYFSIDEVREINDLKKWWKTYPERYNPNGKAPSNLWTYTTAIRGWGNSKQEHLCPFPFSLIEKILIISSKRDDLIFDPFAGSGSLLALAEVMERNSVGIDINIEYKEIYETQVKLGAKEYWDRRQEEISNNKSYIVDFKTTNKILRIHKVASLLVQEISNHDPQLNFKPIIYSTNSEEHTFKLYIITENLNITVPQYSDATLKVIHQSKIEIEIEVVTNKEFSAIPDIKTVMFYKYTAPKIYNFNSQISCKALLDKDNNLIPSVFYSNFSLKLK
ncbi:MAG TPA: site-specific DNA-methyltransferase [Mucilaginibacter sp.]|nr:site-specific DNA-methyltransferase [Mucilaginibacter sp.]